MGEDQSVTLLENIPAGTVREIHRIWDALAGFPAAASEQALKLLLKEVARLINAQNAWWIAGVRFADEHAFGTEQKNPIKGDPYMGWRPTQLIWLEETPAMGQAYKDRGGNVKLNLVEPNESSLNHVKQAGVFRSTLLRDHVSSDYFNSPVYHSIYTTFGFSDALFVVAPANQDVEVYFSFLRAGGQPAFEPIEQAIATYALRSLLWFHRQVLLSFGVHLGNAPLTPTERNVLHLLLTANTESQIAELLSQSKATTHQHITSIYRKFNVGSRAALTALWLRSF